MEDSIKYICYKKEHPHFIYNMPVVFKCNIKQNKKGVGESFTPLNCLIGYDEEMHKWSLIRATFPIRDNRHRIFDNESESISWYYEQISGIIICLESETVKLNKILNEKI